jgi:hypothetical protein
MLAVDKVKVDLGDLPVDRVVSASFTLTNTGDRLLKFTRVPFIQVVDGC